MILESQSARSYDSVGFDEEVAQMDATSCVSTTCGSGRVENESLTVWLRVSKKARTSVSGRQAKSRAQKIARRGAGLLVESAAQFRSSSPEFS